MNASGGLRGSCDCKSKNWAGEVQEMRELPNSKRFSLKTTGMVYRSYIRSAMLYGSET